MLPGTSPSERGFNDAIARLKDWIATGDYQEPTQFLEVLDHIYRLENFHVQRLGKSVYYTRRDADIDGQTVGGIVYARGFSTHKLFEVAKRTGSRPFTMRRSSLRGGDTLRGPGVRVVWIAHLPLPDPQVKPRGRDVMYDQRVAGRDVISTFEDAERFFASV
jgi:hypothetical protein